MEVIYLKVYNSNAVTPVVKDKTVKHIAVPLLLQCVVVRQQCDEFICGALGVIRQFHSTTLPK
jgi:hypothetical protein